MSAWLTGYPPWVAPAIAIGVVMAIAIAACEAAARAVRRLAQVLSGPQAADTPSVTSSAPVRFVRWATFVLVLVVGAPPALGVAGVTLPGDTALEGISAWVKTGGLRLLIIWLVASTLGRAARVAVDRFEAQVSGAAGGAAQEHTERSRRAQTLGRLVYNAIRSLVFGIAALMALRELHVDIMPILTGAGVVGLAVGFGAQTLVKDIIAGFFVILEDQIRVGDVATINGVGGLVEAITLRTIVLRDVTGAVHVFPNGSITTLANQTKDFSFYVIDLGVAFKEDPNRVMQVLERVGSELRGDSSYASDILEPLEVLGVDAFGPPPQELVIKLRIKTRPTRQWRVGRELRRRIKLAFDAEDIEMPVAPRPIAFQLPSTE